MNRWPFAMRHLVMPSAAQCVSAMASHHQALEHSPFLIPAKAEQDQLMRDQCDECLNESWTLAQHNNQGDVHLPVTDGDIVLSALSCCQILDRRSNAMMLRALITW